MGVESLKAYGRMEHGRMESESSLKVLVCVIGTVRGGVDAWRSLIKHVLQPLNADLALFTSRTEKTILHEVAKYDWSFDDPDWTTELQRICRECGLSENAWHESARRTSYESLWGGVDLDGNTLKGSGMLIMILRDMLLSKLSTLNTYDKIIITRSDHLYFFNHPQISNVDVEIPIGEDWWGITDRHHVVDSSIIETYLCIVKWWMQNINIVENSITKHHNPEQLLALYFKTLSFKVERTPRCMASVSLKDDFTRWKVATVLVPGFAALYFKYPHEYFSHIRSGKKRLFGRRVKYTNNFANKHQ